MARLLIGRRAELGGRPFAAYLVYGLVLLIALQILINLAVNTGLAPTTGLTLPLLSYGGSSLVMTAVSLGVIARVTQTTSLERSYEETHLCNGRRYRRSYFFWLAVAEELVSRGQVVHWIGSRYGLEKTSFQKKEYPYFLLLEALEVRKVWSVLPVPSV